MSIDPRAVSREQVERWRDLVSSRVREAEKLASGLPLPLTPKKAVDIWCWLRAECLQWIQATVQHAAKQKGREPTCKTCTSGSCCCLRVDVVLMDAVPIVMELESRGKLTRDFLWTCRERVRAELAAGKPSSWVARKIPCFFLQNGRCSIYEMRPVPCAQFYVWSDSALCVDMNLKNMQVLVSPPLSMLYVAFGGLMDRLLGIYGSEAHPTTLAGALWVMGTAWPLRDEPRKFRREIWKLIRKVALSSRNAGW